MTHYADTNFLVRLYLELPDSETADALVEAGKGRKQAFPLTWLHRLEMCNAFQISVFQGRNPGQARVTPEQAGVAWADFRDEQGRTDRFFPTALATADLERQFEELSLRHTARRGFRTYDLIHVASALLLGCDTFWSFDEKATRLAALEGLKTR